MTDPIPDYQLLDFGGGRKLERFGDHYLDRPSPAAEGHECERPECWELATAKYTRNGERGRWSPPLSDSWEVDCQLFRLRLTPTPFGHIGVFPEQWVNWQWIARVVGRRAPALRVLNLFAYTGAVTLTAASQGASVVHVDAAKTTVRWASRNAELSGVHDRVRWIVEDARRFVSRELKRGHAYDAIVLDPPSYGHGPKGEAWKLSHDLVPLLKDCVRLLSDRPAFLLLTCHSPGFGPAEIGAILQQTLFARCSGRVDAYSLHLGNAGERRLPAGAATRIEF